MKKKALLMVLAAALIVVASIGGTLAWLSDKTDAITNTFTAGKVDISLAETTGTDYVLVPGAEIAKNPKITVKANSEDSYVFVKVKNPLGQGITLDIASADWQAVSGISGLATGETVYKYVGSLANSSDIIVKSTSDINLQVFTKVTVPNTLTNTMTGGDIVVTAYAVQASNLPAGYTDAQIYALAAA